MLIEHAQVRKVTVVTNGCSNSPSALLPLLHDVASDGSSAVVLGRRPLQLHEVLVPVARLGAARLARLVCEPSVKLNIRRKIKIYFI